jgi:DNA-binding response OmpR family regulator
MSPAKALVVLYVEDDVLIRELVEITLQEFGFEVVGAADGTTALDALKDNVVPFRALVTDVNLGTELDGWEIARRARELRRALPVVYVSGASGHQWKSNGVPDSVMIAKPFTPKQLAGTLSSLLKADDNDAMQPNSLPPPRSPSEPKRF